MKINRTSIALAGALALALAAFAFVYTAPPAAPATTAHQEVSPTSTASLTVQGLYTGKQIEISARETVLQLLQTLDARDPQLRLATKEYSGIGTMVVGMNGEQNGAGKNYWQYKVNGVMPQIGADTLKLTSGDSIEWFFGPSQE